MKWSGSKIIIPILLFLPVIWHNFFSINPITVGSDFSKRTPWFDYLLPVGRTARSDNGFVLQAEPVYFDLLLPMRLQNLRLVLKFQTGAERVRVGIQKAAGWSYYFPQQISNGNKIIVLVESFTYVPDHHQRFIISVPDLSVGAVEVTYVEAVMTRHEFNWQWLYDRTINRYKLWINKLLAPLERNTRPFTKLE